MKKKESIKLTKSMQKHEQQAIYDCLGKVWDLVDVESEGEVRMMEKESGLERLMDGGGIK